MTEDDKAQRSEDFSEWLKENGYDGAEIWSQIMILESEHAKRTDPVTYDNDGNVIPLSERFNEETGDIRYSIGSISGKKGEYGEGVILDTNLFKGVKPSKWGNILGKFVYKNLAGKQFTMYDADGNPETVELARENDRVKKDGAKNSHKVIDKLARYKGDNIKALATVHISELLAVSRNEQNNDEHSHQWMDENGWTHRTAYVQDRSGKIYEATLNIANGRDRRILYDINMVHEIDRSPTGGAVPSAVSGGARTTSRRTSDSKIPQEEGNGKMFSFGSGLEAARLARENEVLREKVNYWRSRVKGQDRKLVEPREVRKLAEEIAKDMSATMKPDEIANRLEELYNGLRNDWSFDRTFGAAMALAREIVEGSEEIDDTAYREYEAMRKYFRETPLVLSPSDREQITDYNDWRKRQMGRMREEKQELQQIAAAPTLLYEE